jgi:hypothetical protein
METKTTTKTNPLLMDITTWVTKHFKENPTHEQKGFNVHCYSQAEKEDAVATLTARGFTCVLENNDNNLSVTA